MIGASAAGFTLAFMPMSLLHSTPAQAMASNSFEPTVWYAISATGEITVNIAEAEMGQHVGTALARIVAEELEANWDDVRLNYVDTQAQYGYLVTGGSWSIWQNFDLLSRAGAAGKLALLEEGAKLLGVPVTHCIARNSQVVAGADAISYAEIVQRGDISRTYTDEQLAAMPIKDAQSRKLIGVDTQALDIPDKTTGSAIYGIDATYPGMVYGKPLIPPTRLGSRIKSVDDSAAKTIVGYQQTLVLDDPSGTVPGWAVVIADSFHAALRAAQVINVDWQAGETATVSEADILDRGAALIKSSVGSLVVDDEGVDAIYAGANNVLKRTYTTSTVLHFQLEPVNAIAVQKDGIWELHTGNQWQSLAMPTYAKALGV
ncbi:MAG: CO/xanthine dehydrogenase Mo-binding subunit, partial [Candidatus Azotimanducaceae bacterium]